MTSPQATSARCSSATWRWRTPGCSASGFSSQPPRPDGHSERHVSCPPRTRTWNPPVQSRVQLPDCASGHRGGASGGGRTRTPDRKPDFKSGASSCSATDAVASCATERNRTSNRRSRSPQLCPLSYGNVCEVLGGSQTRVCGFAGRCLATRPRARGYPGRSRTCNQRINNPLLCQLSYGALVAVAGLEPATARIMSPALYRTELHRWGCGPAPRSIRDAGPAPF